MLFGKVIGGSHPEDPLPPRGFFNPIGPPTTNQTEKEYYTCYREIDYRIKKTTFLRLRCLALHYRILLITDYLSIRTRSISELHFSAQEESKFLTHQEIPDNPPIHSRTPILRNDLLAPVLSTLFRHLITQRTL